MTSTSYVSDLDRELNEMAERELRGDTMGALPSDRRQLPLPDVLPPGVSADDKNLAMITHVTTIGAAVFTGGLVDVAVPAVAYILFKDKSAWLRDHVRHQLNFQLTALTVAIVGAVIAAVTLGIGAIVAIPAVLFFFIADIVCSIKAAIAASRGEQYEFPFTIDFLK